MAFFQFVSDMMKKESAKNQNNIGRVTKSSPGDTYDVETAYGIIKSVGIIYPGGVARQTVSYGAIGRKTYYKNVYKVNDVVNLTSLHGNSSQIYISGKLEDLSSGNKSKTFDISP